MGPLIVEPDQGYAPIYTLLALGEAHPRHDDVRVPRQRRGEGADRRRRQEASSSACSSTSSTTAAPTTSLVFNDLVKHGIKVQWASTKVAITHQKSFVVDGARAVIMTGNQTSSYYATSRDFAVVDTNRGDVDAIAATFALDWEQRGGRPRRARISSGAPARRQPWSR